MEHFISVYLLSEKHRNVNLCIWARSHPILLPPPDGTALLLTVLVLKQGHQQDSRAFIWILTLVCAHTQPHSHLHTSQHQTATLGWCSHVWESGSGREGAMAGKGRSTKSFPSQQGSKHSGCKRTQMCKETWSRSLPHQVQRHWRGSGGMAESGSAARSLGWVLCRHTKRGAAQLHREVMTLQDLSMTRNGTGAITFP